MVSSKRSECLRIETVCYHSPSTMQSGPLCGLIHNHPGDCCGTKLRAARKQDPKRNPIGLIGASSFRPKLVAIASLCPRWASVCMIGEYSASRARPDCESGGMLAALSMDRLSEGFEEGPRVCGNNSTQYHHVHCSTAAVSQVQATETIVSILHNERSDVLAEATVTFSSDLVFLYLIYSGSFGIFCSYGVRWSSTRGW